jgi:hypothetical protein
MSQMTYEQFTKSFFKARKKGDSREPMSEKDFREMMGLDIYHHITLMVRPKKDARRVAPSLEVHEKKQVEENKPHLKNDELLKKIDELIVKKERKPRKKEVNIRTPRLNSLAHMSEDEKRAYRSAKRLEQYHKNKVLKPKIILTDEDKKARRSEYNKSYLQKCKELGRQRKPLTEAQKEAQKLWKINNRRKHGIQERTKMSDEARKQAKQEQAERYREKMKAEGRKRIYTEEQRKRYAEAQRLRDQQKREGMVA